MIVTVYHANGKKERRPIGYGGGLCTVATAPYEVREITGQMKKTLTDEACLEPAVQTESVGTKQTVGGR